MKADGLQKATAKSQGGDGAVSGDGSWVRGPPTGTRGSVESWRLYVKKRKVEKKLGGGVVEGGGHPGRSCLWKGK